MTGRLKALLGAGLLVAWAPVGAQFGLSGVAKEWTQLANNAQLVHIAGQEVRQLATQIQQYQWMLRQGQPLTGWQVRDVIGDLNRLHQVLARGTGMADDMGAFDRRFREAYRDYDHYAAGIDPAAAARDRAADYRRWNTARMDAVRDAYYSAGLHAASFRDEDAAAREIERQMRTATGQMQVLQASGAIARMEVEQLQKLRQMMSVQIKLQGEAIAADAERQATLDADSADERARLRAFADDLNQYLESQETQ